MGTKVGIITFCSSKDNYGQILQCYALQQYLRKNGYGPFLIRYEKTSLQTERKSLISRLISYICKFPTYYNLFKQQRREKLYVKCSRNEERRFDDFVKNHIVCSERSYSGEDLLKEPPLADAYICGSDQIWGGDYAYYLNFAPNDSKKIAYAASFGGRTSFTDEYTKEMRRLLHRFDFVGVREISGVETCVGLGVDAVHVADPTLLLKKEDYDLIRTSKERRRKYIFIYLLGNPTDLELCNVYDFAKRKQLDVIYVASQGQYDKYEKEYPTIGEWIDYIANAELVITNSFHGTVFSLIYSTPFITVPLSKGYERMNTRVFDLLSRAGLSDQIFSGNINEMNCSDVSFDQFVKYVKEDVERSQTLLLKALEK